MATAPRATPEQLLASNPSVSAWVTASAGAGKTHVLTDRLLRLLLAGNAPERMLCLTFTKAAAAEMYNRLHERLGAWAVANDAWLGEQIANLSGQPADGVDLADARRLFTRVLEAPGGLKIQTIHGFCESLLRRFPVEAGIAPHFQVMDERDAGQLLALAQDRVLADAAAEHGDLIDAVAALANQDQFQALMTQLMSDRNRLHRFLAGHGGDAARAAAAVPRLLGLEAGEDEAAILASACDDAAFDVSALHRTAVTMQQHGVRDQARAATILHWLAEPARRVAGFDSYLAAFFTEKGQGTPFADVASKATQAAQADAAEILQAESARLAAVRARRRTAQTAAATAALVRLGAALLQAYEAEKQQQARLDYDDLILFAQALLTERSAAAWVLFKLDGGIDHILLDEAQDTNREQWQVVQSVADEFFAGEGARAGDRTIFAVGDVKQSIYSFQRADPQAFAEMRDYFAQRVQDAGQVWRTTPLQRSYRSVEAVLQAVDVIFADADARDGLSADETEIRHISERAGQAGLVEIWPTEQPRRDVADSENDETWQPPLEQQPEDAPAQRLASRIGAQIETWLKTHEPLVARGRPVTAGDVLILVQKRAPFVEVMVRELKQRGIAVAGVDRMVLTEQLAVMDLMVLGQFLLLPEDDLALATVLKSPLVGFDDALLFELAWGRDGNLWQALQRRQGEQPMFAAAHRQLAELLGRVDRLRPFELYADLLGRGGGRHRMLARLGPDAEDPIDEFLDLALAYERENAPSLQGFLHWLQAATTVIKRDMEPRRDEVRVMTVHGAKGLQAPIVFLADTCRVPDEDRLLYWVDGVTGSMPVWRPQRESEAPAWAQARAAARRRTVQEYRRLFYVALTRAADRLYVCGFEGQRARRPDCWYELAWNALDADPDSQQITMPWGNTGLRLVSPQRVATPAPETAPPGAAASSLPAWARAPAPAEPVPPTPLAPSRPTEDDPAVASPLGDDGRTRFRRGQLVHQLLQWLPELPTEARATAARRFLARAGHALPPEEQTEICAQVLAVLDDPAFAALFGPGSRAEVAVSGVVGDRAISGQIDRLVVGDSTVLVVDYKSNRPPPSTSADVAPAYLRQLAAYRALLGEIYPDKSIHCALLWTAVPALMAIPDGLLEAGKP